MKFRISEIQANPFRHIDRYPIRQDKVAALRESLRATGFWDNVVARVRQPTKTGVRAVPEIAYGHHRLFALREEYDGDFEVNLIIRDLSDDAMLKIMARENMEEWGTSAAVEHETVRAVVEAYAEGKIDLPRPVASIPATQIRDAPSFVAGKGRQPVARPYTAREVSEFLGWLQPDGTPANKVQQALAALQFIEEGTLAEADFDGLTTMQAQSVVEQARRARAASEAKARDERAQAERAQRQAADAEKRRAAAEKEREQRAAQAERVRDEQARLRAEREAVDAARRAAAAEREREQAENRKAAVGALRTTEDWLLSRPTTPPPTPTGDAGAVPAPRPTLNCPGGTGRD